MHKDVQFRSVSEKSSAGLETKTRYSIIYIKPALKSIFESFFRVEKVITSLIISS